MGQQERADKGKSCVNLGKVPRNRLVGKSEAIDTQRESESIDTVLTLRQIIVKNCSVETG